MSTSDKTVQLSFLMFLLLGAITALTPLAIDMYLPAMPTIADDLGVEAGKVQMTLTAYTLFYAFGQLIHGPLADSFGRKPIIILGTILFAITSVFSVYVSDVDTLITLRAVQGFAGAAAAVVIVALIRDLFADEEYARTMSYITLIMTVAPLIAPMVGGHLTEWFGWRSIFILLTVYAVVIIFLIHRKIPETLPLESRREFKLRGILRNYLSLLTNKSSLGLMFSSAFSFAGLFSFITAGSFVYIDLFGLSPTQFGYLFSTNVIFMIIFTTLNGGLVRKLGSHHMLRIGLSIQLVSGFLLLLSWFFNWGLWGIAPFVSLFVGPMAMVGSNSMALLLKSNAHMAGTASSLAGTLRFGLGAVISGIIALLPHDSSAPMLISMFACGLFGILSYYFLARDA